MNRYLRSKKLWLLAAVIASLVISHFSGSINGYYLQVILFVGINIILAVSLNLINGYTGQFSLGHAGFMAIGAYTSAYLSKQHSAGLLHTFGGGDFAIGVLFTTVLVAGGLAAALAGLIVGVPSLRLRGDYLAIVTLGFGEIIRVIIQNTETVGGASGYPGVPGLHDVLLGLRAGCAHDIFRGQPDRLHVWPGLPHRARRRGRRRGDGH